MVQLAKLVIVSFSGSAGHLRLFRHGGRHNRIWENAPGHCCRGKCRGRPVPKVYPAAEHKLLRRIRQLVRSTLLFSLMPRFEGRARHKHRRLYGGTQVVQNLICDMGGRWLLFRFHHPSAQPVGIEASIASKLQN